MISVYQNKINNNVTLRDREAMERYIRLIQWGRRNPVQFIERVLGITLMDYQKWLIASSWDKEYVVWACSRNAGKSFLVSAFIMARTLLFPKLQVQIISEQWQTANDTFKKMEDVATNNIKTIVNTNVVFIDELYRTKSDSDGFKHDAKSGNSCQLCNGSSIQAIAGASRSARGRRSNVNVYDEAGFITKETYDVTEPYMAQSSEFKLGASFDADVYPPEIPNIRLYIGSASDTNSYFFAKYKEGAKQMLVGNPKYFVADISCDVPMHPKVCGVPVKPLLSQEEVDRKMRESEIAAMREYYNIFDHFDLEDCVVSRSDIISSTDTFVPVLTWGGRKHKYIITYDPASKNDNSPVLVTEVIEDESGRIRGKFVHMENLIIRYGDGSKRPMRLDEQTNRLRQLLYEYNGRDKVPAYENVTLVIDGGVGGQAPAIVQELAKDWVDENGVNHHGVYDEDNEFSVLWAEPFPACVSGCLRIVEPKKFRNSMFEAAKLLVPMGALRFPPMAPKYDTLVLDDGTERRLSKAEIDSLLQMDRMKDEMISMVRTKTPSGNVTYQLPPEKRGKMPDDRNYVAVMACLRIKELRDEQDLGDADSRMSTERWHAASEPKGQRKARTDGWSAMVSATSRTARQWNNGSPFQGKSPFTQADKRNT